MSIAHLLEDFATGTEPGADFHVMTRDRLEETRLEAFESGYTAGWDDAVKAQVESRTRIGEDLQRNLEDLSFTYQEAAHQMSLSLEPMFRSLLDTVLPELVDPALTVRIVEQLRDIGMDQLQQPALLVVPAGAAQALQPVLKREFAMPVQIVEEPAFPPGRACLRVGVSEREVDCGVLVGEITQAMDAYINQSKEAALHG